MKRRAIIGREVGRSTTLYLQLQKIYPQYHVECLPTIITQEVPFTLPHIGVGKSPVLLFTSPRAVEHFYRHHQEWANSIEAVAIGEGTSRALYAAGVHPSFISSEESARGMAPQLLAFLQSILLQRAIIQPTSNIAGDFLQQYFNERGVEYHKLITYQVTPHPELKTTPIHYRRNLHSLSSIAPAGCVLGAKPPPFAHQP